MPFVRTRITVSGFTAAQAEDGVADLLEEIRERHWIVNPSVSWDAARRLVIVTTHYEGVTDAERYGKAASDEVWDCVIMSMESTKAIRFKIEEAVVVATAEPDAAPVFSKAVRKEDPKKGDPKKPRRRGG